MNPSRRSVRHLESRDDSNQLLTNGTPRPLTNDSGRGPTPTSGRSSAGAPVTTSGASSSLSRDTPIADNPVNTDDGHQSNESDLADVWIETAVKGPLHIVNACMRMLSVRVRRTPVFEGRCYEQAYVSHIDHPSAFFIQLAQFQNEYQDLHDRINAFYPANPGSNPSAWKRGEYCIAKFTDDAFYRARIIEVPAVTKTVNLYDVVFLDYGNWDKVALVDIHLLLPEFATLPAQALPCSLTRSLPKLHTWHDDPNTIDCFKKLVFEKYVDATIVRKTSRDYWPLTFVDLCLSASKLNVREHMNDFIREVSNDQIYHEFATYLKPQDYVIYSIPHENDDNDTADDNEY